MRLSGKKILVIGASRGIGETIAKSLLKEKAKVIASSRSNVNYDCESINLDINDKSSIKSLKEYLISEHKYLNGIVVTAGISLPPQDKFNKSNKNALQDPLIFKELLDTNLIGVYECICSLENLLEENSSLVFISSIGAHLAFPNNTGYQVSKAGIESMARSISYELGSRNIRSNSIVLGYFKTKMTIQSFNNDKLREERSEKTILNRWGHKSEITGAVKFLLSDDSSYITGTNIVIDGGWLAKGL
tara:strand:+ start:5974 stop:6711 length:738 start_codon:yes stop_codon:yes gene_type:complete